MNDEAANEAWGTTQGGDASTDVTGTARGDFPAAAPKKARPRKRSQQPLVSINAFMNMLARSKSAQDVFTNGEVPLEDGQDVAYVLDGNEVVAVVMDPAFYNRVTK